MNTNTRVHTITSVRPDRDLDRALNLLADAFDFVIVDRCPTACRFCDEKFANAA